MNCSRKMAIDYGDKRIGLAMTDLLGILVSPYKVLESLNPEKNADIISKIIESENVELIIIGLPLNMDGSVGSRAEKTKQFGKLLAEKTKAKIVFHDERLTSLEADERLKNSGIKDYKKRKEKLDMVAAAIILEDYLKKPDVTKKD